MTRDRSPDRIFMRSDQMELMDRSLEQATVEQDEQAAADEARRAEYLERLRAKLPELRQIEGFPIGSDEDILALSDPPYYTACPNPFLGEFIAEHGTPYDEATDDYHREPFASDVSEGKNDPIYNAHSYHTKVPHKAIMRYILHYTKPGDIVLDGFCGTGMTGVAAQLCGSPDPDFKAQVEAEWTEAGHDKPEWGARFAILGDLSPAATFIAYNLNQPFDSVLFEDQASSLLDDAQADTDWMYRTAGANGIDARVEFVVWAEVYVCDVCGEGVTASEKPGDLSCTACSSTTSRRGASRRTRTIVDPVLGAVRKRPMRVPVLVGYQHGRKRATKAPSESDVGLLQAIEDGGIVVSVPSERLMFRDGDWGDLQRLYHEGIEYVHDFYTHRALATLGLIRARFRQHPMSRRMLFLFTSQLANLSLMNRYRPDVSFPYNPMSGTLYVGALAKESSPFTAYRNKIGRMKLANKVVIAEATRTTTASTTALSRTLAPESIDYLFVDPPFGDNLPYSELNFLMESWLGVWTNSNPEAIISGIQGKLLQNYSSLMQSCFRAMFIALKPGRWMTVDFHNSQNRVWTAIQEAIQAVGFVVADVRVLDKQGATKKQITGANSVKQDLVISAYKPRSSFERTFGLEAGAEEGAWDFVRQHLEQLPVFVAEKGRVEVIAERQDYLLYDRMVAFHIQRGASVPLSAGAFYQGLRQRFIERDDMYFTQLQVAEYDRRRLEADEVEQLSVFVVDEKSAIQWVRAEVNTQPQTLQDLTPKFLRELNRNRFEELPELREILDQNFIEDSATHRWRVPDPAQQADKDALRQRALRSEFETYAATKGKLKRFRIEAVRAGIAALWAERDYPAIIAFCERLPDEIVQEDPSLLMYYDNALTRQGTA